MIALLYWLRLRIIPQLLLHLIFQGLLHWMPTEWPLSLASTTTSHTIIVTDAEVPRGELHRYYYVVPILMLFMPRNLMCATLPVAGWTSGRVGCSAVEGNLTNWVSGLQWKRCLACFPRINLSTNAHPSNWSSLTNRRPSDLDLLLCATRTTGDVDYYGGGGVVVSEVTSKHQKLNPQCSINYKKFGLPGRTTLPFHPQINRALWLPSPISISNNTLIVCSVGARRAWVARWLSKGKWQSM